MAAAFCTECRCHVNLRIDTRGEGSGVQPCPTSSFPLHHFRYIPERSLGFRHLNDSLDEWEDVRLFQCSARSCSARLEVQMYSPRLRKAWVSLLVDKSLIEERAKAAMASDIERFQGHAVPPPLNVIGNLRAYIGNALKGEDRRILKNNKKWMLSLGESCTDMLLYLNFSNEVRCLVRFNRLCC
jgi:ubiquitin carboxyl-terminal hydrolase 25